jgi:heat shock protein HslJ
MNNKGYITILVLLGVLLAACTPGLPGGSPQPGSPQPGETVKTLYVGPQLVDCAGVAPQKCLQVKDSPDGEYRLFYDQIEGFEFEEGKEYVLKVSEQPIENPPADSSNIQYRLVDVISSSPSSAPPSGSGNVSSGGSSSATVPAGPHAGGLDGQLWSLDSMVNSSGVMAALVPGSQITAEFKDSQLGGRSGCNNYFASYQVNGNAIQISGAGGTEMFCAEPEGVMDQEAAYLKTLSLAASYQISGGKLQIADASGKPILIYSGVQPATLTGVTWIMTSYNNGTGAVVSALPGAKVTAIFEDDGNLGGSAGCNSYSAAYKLDGQSLTIDQAATTLMACSEPAGIMDQEAAYLKALESVASFELKGDRLILYTASRAIAAEFSLSESAGLSDTEWELSLYYVGGDAVTSPLVGTRLSAHFTADGKLSGSAGCNRYQGSYQMAGDSLTIGPVASTKMACPDPAGVMEQEAAFLVILENTAAYQIKGDTLVLLDSNGAPLAEFIAAP